MNWLIIGEVVVLLVFCYVVGTFVLSAYLIERERRKAPGASRDIIALNTRHAILRNGFFFVYMLPLILIKFFISGK